LRYFGTLVDLYQEGVDLTKTYIPIQGCKAALADKITVRIASRISPERLTDARTAASMSLFRMQNELVQQKQGLEYDPNAFGSEGGPRLGL
jgi:hypothetical protein